MQISSFYRVKKYPPHSKRGGCFLVFDKSFNLMTLPGRAFFFLHYGLTVSSRLLNHWTAKSRKAATCGGR